MKTTHFYIIISFSLLIFSSSCNNNEISEEQLEVIDGIVLGQCKDSLFASYKKLGISKGEFLLGDNFSSISDMQSKIYNPYYSRIFDLNRYNNPSIKLSHIGILYPNTIIGTDKIVSINVILASTSEPLPINSSEILDATRNTFCIKQEINELLINEIIEMYTSKYGEPINRIKTKTTKLYVLQNGTISMYGGNDIEGELISWENEIMNINFYTGSSSYNTTFKEYPPSYLVHYISGEEPTLPEHDSSKGIYGCYSYPYIEYTLKESTISKMNLDKKKI